MADCYLCKGQRRAVTRREGEFQAGIGAVEARKDAVCRPGVFSLVVEEAVAERKEALTNPRPPLGPKCFPHTYGAPIAAETTPKSLRKEEGA